MRKVRLVPVLFVVPLMVGSLCGCEEENPLPEAGPSGQQVFAEFSGRIDPAAGTMTISPSGGTATLRQGLEEARVVQDGNSYGGPADSVELVTISTEDTPGGCGAIDSFGGEVRVNSFYTTQLRNVWVEVTEITGTPSHEACNSNDPGGSGLSDANGLWSYGDLAPNGGTSTAIWRFGNPDGTDFTFKGRVMADWCGDGVCNGSEQCAPSGSGGCPVDCCQVDWCATWWPLTDQLAAGQSNPNHYGQVWVDGLTHLAGEATDVESGLGYGPVGSNPVTWSTWVSGDFNVQSGNNDEHQGTLTAPAGAASGTEYDYMWRFRIRGQSNWTYCNRRDQETPGTLTIQ